MELVCSKLHILLTHVLQAATPGSSQVEIGSTAALHGRELLALGFNVSQVVHDYGDLCQAITELVVELDAPITAQEFHLLNRCLDTATGAVRTDPALDLASQSRERPSERTAATFTFGTWRRRDAFS